VDIRRLPIGPHEAFVMSRVDGLSTIRDIGYATGLPCDKVAQCLTTLETLGAIDYEERPYDPSRQVEMARPNTVSGVSEKSESTNVTSSANPTPPPPSQVSSRTTAKGVDESLGYNPSELDAPCDLDQDRKKTILELYAKLDTFDHYALLGLSRNVDRKGVKSAYYERVKVFHPDRYFGKNLGIFREKLEKCFAQLTDAHETLADAERRAEYDSYLQSQQQALDLERSLNESITPRDLELLEQRLAEAMGPLGKVPLSSPEAAAPAGPSTSPPPSSTSVPIPSGRNLTEDERKKALARKLRFSQPNLRLNIPGSVPPPSIPPKEQIAEQLKRQYAQGRQSSNLGQLQELLSEADRALEKGDPVQASNHLRTAQSIAPSDPRIAERLAETQKLASTALASTYFKQGEYEEKSGRFEAAARSYERAARGQPQANSWESAARCLLEAGGDLRSAGEFAKKAIALEPERPSSHLLLGRIFIAARMRSSALAELERARSLDPNNDTVTSLLKRLERESF
jgi:curved DNA-binding protein CbpA